MIGLSMLRSPTFSAVPRRKLTGLKFKGQLSLPIEHPVYRDRNHELGGRSFYFFDFDDNVAFLSTPILLFHKDTNEEKEVSSAEYAQHHHTLGESGLYKDYRLDFDDSKGSFRNFRDKDLTRLDQLRGRKQLFVRDLAAALIKPDYEWKGPSWDTFFHAVHNQRPLSLITARGHDPETLKQGIRVWVKHGYLKMEPNYHTIYAVSHPETRKELEGAEANLSVASLKKRAIRRSVMRALETYGESAPHRFGMSDDDPKNIQLIVEEMSALKKDFPHLGFFVIESRGGVLSKAEIFSDHIVTIDNQHIGVNQLSLWNEKVTS